MSHSSVSILYNEILIFLAAFVMCTGTCDGLISQNPMELAFLEDIRKLQNGVGNLVSTVLSDDDLDSKIKFYLLSTNSMYELQPGNAASLQNSKFDIQKQTKILIHGFMDSVKGPMITTTSNSFIKATDANVIAVDWSEISIDINYILVAKKTQPVGEFVAKFIDFLVAQGHNISFIHLIGHSLGAHVAGWAGKTVTNGRIPRITGLDPALPGFDLIIVQKRLETSDAEFVDCIHTCGGLLGFMEPICHVDFYPNRGIHAQPGCSAIDFGKCSHFRSFMYFAESVFPDHIYPCLQCSHAGEDSSKCNLTSVTMGYHVHPSLRGIYFAFTLSKYPFAPNIM